MDAGHDSEAPASYRAFTAELPISGASIAVFDSDQRQSTVWASDRTAARVEELQFDLGEGPHWTALVSAVPVLIADVELDNDEAWPLFGAAVRDLNVRALFAFPMMLGAVTVGTVDMYRNTPGALAKTDLLHAVVLCGRVAKVAVLDAMQGAQQNAVSVLAVAPAMRREVHQATGVILAQLNITASEAFFVLRAHAFSHGLAVLEVAKDVVAGRLDFRGVAR